MKLLEKLALTAGVPGREHRVRDLIRKEIDGLFDSVEEDPLGSLICIRKPRGGKSKAAKSKAGKSKAKASKKAPTRVMLAAHMDQIGFLVNHIDDAGYLRLVQVGGFDTRNLFARTVTVCPDVNDPSKDLPGVLNPSGRPVHIASPEDRKKVPVLKEFMVDMGMDGDAVKEKVKIGDMVVLRAPFTEVGDTVVSQCMDNRVACWVAIEAVKKLKSHACEVHCVFTSQEEVGLRGARTSAYTVKPDIGIAIDVTLCVDTPGVPTEERVTKQGDGAALTVMDGASIGNLDIIETFETVAVKKKIKAQRSILPAGGTDAGTIQMAGSGVPTMTLSCPCRYVHTVTEMVHKDDLHACRDLLAAYLTQVK